MKVEFRESSHDCGWVYTDSQPTGLRWIRGHNRVTIIKRNSLYFVGSEQMARQFVANLSRAKEKESFFTGQ